MAQWVREPQMIVWGLIFPIIFVLLFAYVFGSGIIVPGGGNYREFLMPGMFAQTMAFGIGETLAAVQADTAKGVTDRFRSMPMAPSAVVVGRCIAGMVYSAASLALLAVAGLAIGWRWHGTLAEAARRLRAAAAAAPRLPVDRHRPRAQGQERRRWPTAIFGLLYPVTMLSNAFVATELMPGWLGTIAEWNPLSATITATRELFGNPGAGGVGWLGEHAIQMAIVWPLRHHRGDAAPGRPRLPAPQPMTAGCARTVTDPSSERVVRRVMRRRSDTGGHHGLRRRDRHPVGRG